MQKNYKQHIFDVGAYNGIDGIGLALNNPNSMVYAFEANPNMISVIKVLKKKIENRIGKKIRNYKCYNLAVSNFNKETFFYIAKNPTVSSLNKFSKNIDRSWPGYSQNYCKVIKKIKIKTITLNKFVQINKIDNISYLHIDTQGNDLKVLKGLGPMIANVKSGKMEAAISKKKKLYEENHTLKEVKIFLKKKNFIINKINYVDKNIKNEVDIHFSNKLTFKKNEIKNNFNKRYFQRVLDDKTYLKDNFKDFFIKLINILIY